MRAIQPGYRLISFDANGQISTKLGNILNVSIRETVRQDKDLMKNDYGKIDLLVTEVKMPVVHDIDKVKTFGPSTALQSNHSALIEEVAGNASITKLNEGKAIVIKKIPSGVNLTIAGNHGTVVAQRNEGNLVVKNNYGKVNVDENVGKVTVQENTHTIVIHENGDPTRPSSGTVEINDNGKFFPQSRKPLPVIGPLITPRTAELRIYNNLETVKINCNTDWIEFGINKGTIEIVKNPNRWIQKDPRIFIYRNEKNVSISENGGKIYVFDNSRGTLDVRNNSDVVTVSTSKIGNRTGAGANTINKDPLSDEELKALFEGKATGEPKIDDANPGP